MDSEELNESTFLLWPFSSDFKYHLVSRIVRFCAAAVKHNKLHLTNCISYDLFTLNRFMLAIFKYTIVV